MVLLILSALLTGLFSYFLYHWSYWIRRGVPGPRGFPVLGVCTTTYSGDYPPFLNIKKWGEMYGPIFGFTEGLEKTLVVSDPDLVHEVFVKQFDNFYGRKLNALHGDPEKDTKASMFMAQGYRWKRLRTISSPSFSNNSLRKVTGIVEECAVELIRHIERDTSDDQQIDMLQFYQEFTLDVIGRIAMGQPDSQMFQNPLLPHVKSIFGKSHQTLMTIGAVFPPALKLLKWMVSKSESVFGAKPMERVIWTTVAEAVKKRMGERIENDPEEDFIDLFLNSKLDGNDDRDLNHFHEVYSLRGFSKVSKNLTTDEIIAQCTLFIIAGFDTTALSLSFTTYLLALHPDVQKKLQKEVDEQCPDPDITFDQLAKLKYLELVMKETLRLYPLATPANSRTCMKETVVGGVKIEKGVHVVANTWAIHTDKRVWGEDADQFRPERWESNDDHLLQKGTYIPFGLGPRQCIGMRLAYMEEKMLLAHILRRYTFETGTKTEIPMRLVGRATTQPTSVWMHLKARD